MTGIGSAKPNGLGSMTATASPVRAKEKSRSWLDAFLTFLCNCLCTASRGYLCCPECDDPQSDCGAKEKLNENVSGK